MPGVAAFPLALLKPLITDSSEAADTGRSMQEGSGVGHMHITLLRKGFYNFHVEEDNPVKKSQKISLDVSLKAKPQGHNFTSAGVAGVSL
jgi:hypothetical protein